MKKAILIIVILAVVGVLAYKFLGNKAPGANTNVVATATPQTNTPPATDEQKVLYLFHDPRDQDEGCKAIYAFADSAEKDLKEKVHRSRRRSRTRLPNSNK